MGEFADRRAKGFSQGQKTKVALARALVHSPPNVILDEPWRIEKLRANADQFIHGLQQRGFNTLQTETAIVPVLCVEDETAYRMTQYCQNRDVFVLPVVSPAVPVGLARLRATVTAAHEADEIEHAMDVVEAAGKELGLIN